MLPIARWSPRTKASLAVAMALLLWIPQGISTETTPVVTGHSVFYNGETYDQCLASIAGILRSRVMWFNDQVLVERYPGKGTFVFVTEEGAPDPTAQSVLISEGVRYSFKDPNGVDWVIHEAHFDPGVDPGQSNLQASNTRVHVNVNKTYVWFVELSETPVLDQFPGEQYPHNYYNFLVLVDTCKFHPYTRGPLAKHNNSAILNDRYGHPNADKPHAHETWGANIWIGKRPVVVEARDTGDRSTEHTSWAGVTDDQDRPMADGDHRPQ